MQIRQTKILGYVFIAFMVLGCDTHISKKESNVSIEKENQKISKELEDSMVDYIYTVNGKKYGVNTLPSLYTKVSGKKRKLFIEKYLNYTLSLESLLEEQKKYKKEINRYIKQEFEKNRYRGIVLDELEKEILIKTITLRTIAREEMAKEIKDLDKKVKEFYSKNEKKYHYKRNIEISYIRRKDEKKIKDILAKLTKKKVDIRRFASFAKEYSLSKRMRFNSGYFGYLLEDKRHKEFFYELWKTKENGFVPRIIKSNESFMLVYIHQKRGVGLESFEDVKDTIRTDILSKRVGIWINRHYRKIMKNIIVDIFDTFENNKSF
jgi:hypothetical protein